MTTQALFLGGLLCCAAAPGGEPPLVPLLPTGHSHGIHQAYFNSDGKRLLTIGSGRAILWDTDTGKMLRAFNGDALPSPDLKLVALRSGDKTPILVDAATGKQLHVLEGHLQPLTAWAFSGDGKVLATGSYDKTAIVWDTATGKKRHVLKGHGGAVNSVTLSGDGKTLVTWSSEGNTGFVWATSNGVKRDTFDTQLTFSVGSARLSADGTRLLTREGPGGGSKEMILWNVNTAAKIQTYRAVLANLSSDGRVLVTVDEEGLVTAYETAGGQKRQSVQVDKEPHALAMNADGAFIVTASPGKQAVLSDLANGRQLFGLEHAVETNGGVAFSPYNGVVAVWSGGGVTLWDGATGKQKRSLQQLARGVRALAVGGNGRLLATLPSDAGPAVLWDLAAGKITHALLAHKQTGGLAGFSPDGKVLVTTGAEPLVVMWNTATGQQLQSFKGGENEYATAAVSGDGTRLVLGITDGTIVVWDTGTGKVVKEFKAAGGGVGVVGLNADGTLLLTTELGGGGTVWDVAAAKPLQSIQPSEGVFSCANLSRDGKLVAFGRDKGALTFDASTGLLVRAFDDPDAPINRVRFSADGKHLLTCNKKSVVTMWEVGTGKKLRTFAGHSNLVGGLNLSADGKRLWTASWDGTVRLWDVATGEELCALLSLDDGKDWLVVTPTGLYDGSDAGRAAMAWQRPGVAGRIEDEATRKQMHRAGLLGRILKGEQVR